MLINIKVKTLDAQTHEFSIDNEITVREFKDKVAEKTNIDADLQRIIYCGRVMVDEKQLKDYDVDGKVVHIAERLPPSQRLQATESSSSNANPPSERRNRGRTVNMRNSPFFRALDGMVVGTMAFPVNANSNGQDTVNPFAASSSFCMNRITVALHMLECVNNIVAYLEDPSRGLNNQSLDILARGRWTMESTVVEVGITSDMPQSQQIVEMVQGAVQAALRRNGNTNVTLVQLPTVYSTNENESNNENAAITGGSSEQNNDDAEAVNTSSAAASVIEDDEDTPTNDQSENNSGTTSSTMTTSAAADNNASTATDTNEDANENSRRRTGTPVLAGVIEQMRNVQQRLNPFIQQYYELLQNEPTFEENDTAGRENAQRLFDRVSEAFHYMSHAQHAISDLMLDVSQGTPRYLTCRPILVEQSGYVSSNNILTPTILPAALRQQHQRSVANASLNSGNATRSMPNTNSASATTSTSNREANSGSDDANNSTVDDPIDDPVIWQPTINLGLPASNDNTNGSSNNVTPAAGRGNLQRQVARLLQDVVSAAPFDTEFHVHINNPNVVQIDVPIGVSNTTSSGESGVVRAGGTEPSHTTNTTSNSNENNTTTSTTNTAATTSNDNTSTNTNSSSSPTANPARVTTATLPTTSTQTRSTSRPQVHFGNIPVLGMPTGWNGRVLPSNNVSSFDRFLPCNSHHIREPERRNAANAANNNTSASARANRPNPVVGSTMATAPRLTNNARTGNTLIPPPVFDFVAAREEFARGGPSTSSTTSSVPDEIPNFRKLVIHGQLLDFLNNSIFEGKPINDDTTPLAINRAIQWFGESLLFLPQYEKPEYDSRDSLFNILRTTLPVVIEFLTKIPTNLREFERNLRVICQEFRKRLYTVLYICIGQGNAEIFWVQLMRLLYTSIYSKLPAGLVDFLKFYLNPAIPIEIDEVDARQFIVFRKSEASVSENEQPLMDTDVEMAEVATTSQPEADDVPLPSVVPGSENWHRLFPNDWLPIITRDIQRQTDNPPNQPPFSDAYISGMSSKRRKLVQNCKAPTDISALIADSVKKAVQNSEEGGTSKNCVQGHTPEGVAVAISRDPVVQSSCIDAIRTNVQERLKNDTDFEAEKFPKSNHFINK